MKRLVRLGIAAALGVSMIGTASAAYSSLNVVHGIPGGYRDARPHRALLCL